MSKTYYAANPEAKKRDAIKRTYGLDWDVYQEMISNGCEVCGVKEDLVVDHDHSCCSGKKTCGKCVRGILCQRHNKAEGFLRDSDDALALAFYMVKNANILKEVS